MSVDRPDDELPEDKRSWAAFPVYEDWVFPGMSAREFYAGLALQGLLASHTGQTPLPPAKEAARQAVEFADALLEELRT